MGVPRVDVEFESHGAVLRGWLYPAGGSSPGPGMVMAHGLSAVKEMFLDRYAERFAAAGFTTLVYDHFGFGASEGEPRQWPAPSVQLQGYRDAIGWLAARSEVDSDRIGIWGSSFSGGEVIILAAEDLGIGCAVAQVPAFGVGEPGPPPAGVAAIIDALGAERDDVVIAAVTDRDDGVAVMHTDRAAEWFARVATERAPSWRNELRVSAFAEPFRPVDHLTGAKVPLLLIVAPDDAITPPAAGVAVADQVDAVEVVELSGGHFEAYEAGFEDSVGAAVDWYRRHLVSVASTPAADHG